VAKQLKLSALSSRHPGLTKAIGDSYTEAASVCLSRFHESPANLEAEVHERSVECEVAWRRPRSRTLHAWANEIDTTEQGAYGLSLAAVEALEGLVAISGAETLTGADYYVAPIGSDADDLEEAFRLEVSGVSAGGKSVVESRLRSKLKQAGKAANNHPALAAVIGFKERLILVAQLRREA
jgi:hypothetical protein